MRKGIWSPDEDEKLKACIAQHQSGSWSDIARKAGLQRCGKSCRRRWMNHLRPNLKRAKFTTEEVRLVAKLHEDMGNKWSHIATHLDGRTDNDVKNIWNTQIKRRRRISPKSESQLAIIVKNVNFPFSMEANEHKREITLESLKCTTTVSRLSTCGDIDTTIANVRIIPCEIPLPSIQTLDFSTQNLFYGPYPSSVAFDKVPLDMINSVDEKYNSQQHDYDMLTCKGRSTISKHSVNESIDYLLNGSHVDIVDALDKPNSIVTITNSDDIINHAHISCDNMVSTGSGSSYNSTFEVASSNTSSTTNMPILDENCSENQSNTHDFSGHQIENCHYVLNDDQEIDAIDDELYCSQNDGWISDNSHHQWCLKPFYSSNVPFKAILWN